MQSEIKKGIPSRLKILRNSLGINQHEMADRLGISHGAWQSYEIGRSAPGSGVIEALSLEGFSADWVLIGEGPMRRDQGEGVHAVITGARGITQVGGHGNLVTGSTVGASVVEEAPGTFVLSPDLGELLELLSAYGSPAIVAEFKRKLLKIKEITEG